MADNRPIGIYDSGLGGLTVWREVRRALPGESLAYLGDGANCPYGSRPREEVQASRSSVVPDHTLLHLTFPDSKAIPSRRGTRPTPPR